MRSGDRDLRTLTQPVFRYQGTKDPAVDGALFPFTIGTDPEAFLLIESRTVDGKPRWHYALCRMTGAAVRASYRGKEVWSVPMLDNTATYGHRETYTKYSIRSGPRWPARPRPGRGRISATVASPAARSARSGRPG